MNIYNSQKTDFKSFDISLKIMIGTTPEFFKEDIALIELLESNTDSQYSKDSFKKEITLGNVTVVLLEDDPIAYAVKKDNKVVEYYIDYEFRKAEIEKILLDF